ncbi:hypothetical protein SAMN05444411_102443 [Lutibacter oricola]|uniref:Probable membrane transporter protein n=1 Tax=Lutibacter oricola TaxID=762486 RepID=A0A1H2XFP5_9FLAO|nr:sulfite exporter TauE/SafE family protein [Lutibacter oricola]SDW91069.1 hypothetical protein SAMN05444411_102443 [Lutibacter oricola]
MPQIFNLIELYQLTYLDLFLAFLAAFILGVGKAGIKGLGVIIVILMALVFGGKASTGVLMPLMIMADILAVIYYHRHTQWKFLWKLLPTMVIGVLIGVLLGSYISEVVFKQFMAVFILATVLIMVFMDRKKRKEVPTNWFFSNGIGLLAGITSMIGNLAGSFANIYFLAMRLPKNEFIGTMAWLFFIINVFKLPFHIIVWKTITVDSFLLNTLLIPGIIIGFFAGVWLVKLINNEAYRKFIIAATAFGALLILFS